MLGPFATRAALRPFSRCRYRYCRAPPAHRCSQRQRQRVTEGTAMAPWKGPNKSNNGNQQVLRELILLRIMDGNPTRPQLLLPLF